MRVTLRARAWLARLLGWLRLAPPAPDVWLRQARPDTCAHTIIAMLARVTPATVARKAGEQGALGVTQAVRVLAALGITCTRPQSAEHTAKFWPVYRQRAGGTGLQGIAFRVRRPGEAYGHACMLHGRWIYDPADGTFRSLDGERLREFDWVVLLAGA